MANIKTYGEIIYYLYDGDKTEKIVSREDFFNSNAVSPTFQYKEKKKKQKQHSVKIVEKFDSFCENFINGPNLPINYNKRIDFKIFHTSDFDGGDGPSGTNVPRKYSLNIKTFKTLRGNNVRKKQYLKRKKIKNLSRMQKIARNMTYQTSDDFTKHNSFKGPLN